MKVFNLICTDGHTFEGWFRNDEDYDKQSSTGLLSCPVCGTHDVRKALSAPRLNLGSHETSGQEDARRARMAEMQQMMAKMVKHVVANTEDVGTRFAEEARKIHYDEAPDRGIRGIATPQETQSLRDEGIDVFSLPVPIADKTSLQ